MLFVMVWVCNVMCDGVCDVMCDGVCNVMCDGVCNVMCDGVFDGVRGVEGSGKEK